ncbi:MAG: 1-acyl-sn-glycerol-3-phosphate acyltransferase [Desulfosudaceae bacterium]
MVKSIIQRIITFVTGLGAFFNKLLDRMLSGTHDHFLCYLPAPKGRDWLSLLFLSRVSVHDEQQQTIRDLQQTSIIVYASKYKSKLEHLVCNRQYGKHGLPMPELVLGNRMVLFQPASRVFKALLAQVDYFLRHFSFLTPHKTNYFQTELTNGKAALFSLFGKRILYPRLIKSKTTPAQELIRVQKAIDTPVMIVPQSIFFSRRPGKTRPNLLDFLLGGLDEKPGKLRRLLLILTRSKNIFIEMSTPVDLKQFLNRPDIRELRDDYQALALRRLMLSRINMLRQRVTGPVLKSREEIKESIMAGQRLQTFIDDFTKQENRPIREVNREAYDYLDEIAANYSMNWVMIYDFILTWMLNHIFDGMVVDQEGVAELKKATENAPLIFVPTHKSHLDYLVLSYVLYYQNIACPHIAAGKNLSFWPLGPIFRGGGAFFMRRSFKGQKLYSKVFLEYIYKILQEGFNIEFFLEGGRSRTGKTLTPKTGLLSILLEAYEAGACRDLIFVPVNIGYDRIIEEAAYVHETEGGEKTKENLPALLKARKSLKRRYGKVYVNFNKPFSVNEYLDKTRTSLEGKSTAERKRFINRLSRILMNQIENVTVVTPHGITAAAILNSPKKRFTSDYLMSIMDIYLVYLRSTNAKLADTITNDHDHAFAHVLEAFAQRKFIEHFQLDSEDKTNPLYMVNENKRPAMEYYKNTCISLFVPAAFTALAILELDSFQFAATDLNKQFEFLQHFFRHEFILESDKTPENFIKKSISPFIENDILVPHESVPGNYNLTSEGLRNLKLFSSFLKSYFESYLIVLTFLKQEKHGGDDDKELLKKILQHGRRMYKHNEIELLESVSKITFKNAYTFFTREKIIAPEDKTKADFYEDRIQKFLTLLS